VYTIKYKQTLFLSLSSAFLTDAVLAIWQLRSETVVGCGNSKLL